MIKDYGYENLCAQPEEPVRPIVILPAREILHSPKRETIVDFGQVISGRVRISLREKKDQNVTLDHFETLDKDGNCFDNLGMGLAEKGKKRESKEAQSVMSQRDTVICDGTSFTYEPFFTFHGFRYVRISGVSELKKEDVCAVALSTEKKKTGTFSCSDPDLNRLYQNTIWSQRANMMSIPTDCPQREKAGWTGDIAVYAETSLLNEDTTALLNRWLKNMALEQDEYGSVPFVVPYAGHYPKLAKIFGMLFGSRGKALVCSSGWGDAAVIVPYQIYQVTGNREVLSQQYTSMKAWCDYIIREAKKHRGNRRIPKEVDRYLWNTGFHWGEWLIPSLSKNGFDVNTIKGMKRTRTYAAPCYACRSMEMMAETAKALGKETDASYYMDMAEKMRRAFAEGVIDKNGDMPADYMGAYVIPIAFDMVPEKWKEHFAAKLTGFLVQNDFCLDTGFLATPFLLEALQKIGREDLAFRVLFQKKCPSWLYEVEHGATTIWESWYGYTPDDIPLEVSMNHYAFGCVDEWMFKNINGIRRTSPGYKTFIIEPRFDGRLTWAKRTFQSVYGPIVSNWEIEPETGAWKFRVEIPCNTRAQIRLPDGRTKTRGSGCYEFTN